MITVTPRAKHAVRMLAGSRSQSGEAVLRLDVTPDARHPGVGRLRYLVDLESVAPGPSDHVFQHDDLTVVVDQQSLPYLDGLELDAQGEGESARFVFNNPHAQHACRCGQTFVPE